MKAHLLACTLLFSGVTLQLHSQGYLIPNGVTPSFYPGNSTFRVLQNPTGDAFTDFTFFPQGSGAFTNTFSFDTALDGGVRVYFVSPGSPVTEAAILSGTYSQLSYPSTYVFDDGIPFYLGLYVSPTDAPTPGAYQNPLFGWAHLVNNGGTINLLGSALAYGADGIYVGTQDIIQSVPEPSLVSLVVIGLIGFGWLRRRR